MLKLHSNSEEGLMGFLPINFRAYFHGKLEERFNYDLFEASNCQITRKQVKNSSILFAKIPLGIYEVEVVGMNETCTMFSWVNSEDEQRGLVVLNSDKEAFNYARKCFEESENLI